MQHDNSNRARSAHTSHTNNSTWETIKWLIAGGAILSIINTLWSISGGAV